MNRFDFIFCWLRAVTCELCWIVATGSFAAVEAGICSARLPPYIRLRSSWFPDPDANICACVPGAAFIRSRRGRKIRAHTRMRNLSARSSSIARLALAMLLVSCASYGPYHANTAAKPINSVRGPADGRYKMAFIEFGDQGSPLDNSQRKAALEVIHKAERPLLFVYIHGWQNNATSGDVCKFEHFLDMVSSFPEFTGRKINVIGVYIAWRGKDLTVPWPELSHVLESQGGGRRDRVGQQLPGEYRRTGRSRA